MQRRVGRFVAGHPWPAFVGRVTTRLRRVRGGIRFAAPALRAATLLGARRGVMQRRVDRFVAGHPWPALVAAMWQPLLALILFWQAFQGRYMGSSKRAKAVLGGGVAGASVGAGASVVVGNLGIAGSGIAVAVTWPVLASVGAIFGAAAVGIYLIGKSHNGRVR